MDGGQQISLQSDDGNDNPILVGDSNLSATRYGVELLVGDGFSFGTGGGRVFAGGRYARTAGTNQVLNINLER